MVERRRTDGRLGDKYLFPRLRPGRCPMPIAKGHWVFVAKIVIMLWGVACLLQGAGLSFFVSGTDQYRQTTFINLVYVSVFVASLVSLLSSRIASLLLLLSTVGALGLLFWTNSFGHGQASAGSLLLAIAVRPALASVLFFFLYRWESRRANASGPVTASDK